MGQDVDEPLTCMGCGKEFPTAHDFHEHRYGYGPATADAAINPAHYQGDLVMRIIEHFQLDFLDGQVVKYVLRSGHKEGSPALQDYKKCLWYLERKIRTLERPDSIGIPPGLLELPK